MKLKLLIKTRNKSKKPQWKHVYNLLLKTNKKSISFKKIVNYLKTKKIIRGTGKELSRLWSILTLEQTRRFYYILKKNEYYIGLTKWLPPEIKPKRIKAPSYKSEIDYLDKKNSVIQIKQKLKKSKDKIFTHLLTKDEIEKSYLTTRPSFIKLFDIRSDTFPINIYCYGGFSFKGWLSREFKTIASSELKNFYFENELTPGDNVYINKGEDSLSIFISTKWLKNLDKYLREINWDELEKSLINSPQLSIKDLIYIYLFSNNEPKPIEDIISAVKNIRQEVAISSIRTILNTKNIFIFNSQLKVWGLSYWPQMEEFKATPFFTGLNKDSKIDERQDKLNDPVYLLSLIQKKDYVYKILKYENKPLSANEIADKIALELGIKKDKILELTFIDLNDKRIKRLKDGSFILLRERLEAIEIKNIKNELIKVTDNTKKVIIFIIKTVLIFIIIILLIMLILNI